MTDPATLDAMLNECIAELGDGPFVVSRDDDGWAVRTLSAWRVLNERPSTDDVERVAAAIQRAAEECGFSIFSDDAVAIASAAIAALSNMKGTGG